MADVKTVVSVTQKEFEALSFFQHEINDKMESAEDESYTNSMNAHLEHYNSFKKRLFDSKSKQIHISEDEFTAFVELRYEAAGKIEQISNSDSEYIADFNRHDRRFSNLQRKYKKAKNEATVKWALNKAKEYGIG